MSRVGHQHGNVLQMAVEVRRHERFADRANEVEAETVRLRKMYVEEKIKAETGKSVENAHIESFNGRLREERLNQHAFVSLDDARM